jgi:AraC-like DNA-binding protein
VLGHAGLLDHHHVTTHWHYTERLIKAFPKAIVETDRIYLQDGRLITSGGITAGIDLALSIVAQDHGKEVAVEVAKVLLVVMKRQGGQAQFSPMTAAVSPQETAITRVQNQILARLEQPHTIDSMAELAGLSPRHFARLFAKDVQMTPMAFLQGARIDRARQLLETTDLPLKTVAFHAGFGSVRHMRAIYRKTRPEPDPIPTAVQLTTGCPSGALECPYRSPCQHCPVIASWQDSHKPTEKDARPPKTGRFGAIADMNDLQAISADGTVRFGAYAFHRQQRLVSKSGWRCHWAVERWISLPCCSRRLGNSSARPR